MITQYARENENPQKYNTCLLSWGLCSEQWIFYEIGSVANGPVGGHQHRPKAHRCILERKEKVYTDN